MSENTQIQKANAPREIRVVQDGSEFSSILDTARFEQMQRVSTMFSESTIIPEHYRKNIGNCFIAIQMATRMGVDPFMFMQKTYVVHGKPGMEAQLAIALMNTSGIFENALDYEIQCENADGDAFDPSYRVRAFAKRKATGKQVFGPWIDWKLVKGEGWEAKPGSKWKTMPGMMFIYRAATFFGRMHCPERLMGMSTSDELEDIGVQVTPTSISITDGKGEIRPNDKYAAARKIEADDSPSPPSPGAAAPRNAPGSESPKGESAPTTAKTPTSQAGSPPETPPTQSGTTDGPTDGPGASVNATGTTGEARDKQAGAVGAQAAPTPPTGKGRPKAKKHCPDCGAPLNNDGTCPGAANHAENMPDREHEPSKGVQQAEGVPPETEADAFAREGGVDALSNWLMSKAVPAKVRAAAMELAGVKTLVDAKEEDVRNVAYNAKLHLLQTS